MVDRRVKRVIISLFFFSQIVYFRGFFMYGLISKKHLDEIIINVVNTLGGGQNAINLLSETAMAETNYGDTPDLHLSSGYGIFQFDRPGFADVQARTPQSTKVLIQKVYNIDIDNVSILALQWSPLLSTIFARLFYLLRPGAIPSTLECRAAYWKQYYNTYSGAGTIAHYIEANSNQRFENG
ncbi:hypothetical protein [Sulfurospirillum sp. 1612]|uniref:hypothetical protein n=1 Tax=Sulfurospirillum sp. 1612 TaxID=3094835 RepID=UPI002F950C88